MFFGTGDSLGFLEVNKWREVFLTYLCRNCGRGVKIFAITVARKDNKICEAYKFGEYPSFGPPTPPRVIKMIGPDRELFLQGRRCENQALGIGAFTYYRRVVEKQWGRLIDQIIRVAEVTRAKPETIALLEKAKQETQFSKSVEILRDAIPPTLLINGHNPLVLLHGPLSQGVHTLSDEECLSLATSIRVVLAELAEKVSNALKDVRELKDAVSQLLLTSAKKKGENVD